MELTIKHGNEKQKEKLGEFCTSEKLYETGRNQKSQESLLTRPFPGHLRTK